MSQCPKASDGEEYNTEHSNYINNMHMPNVTRNC